MGGLLILPSRLLPLFQRCHCIPPNICHSTSNSLPCMSSSKLVLSFPLLPCCLACCGISPRQWENYFIFTSSLRDHIGKSPRALCEGFGGGS